MYLTWTEITELCIIAGSVGAGLLLSGFLLWAKLEDNR